ncbi:MAG: hypothetical protein KDI88_16815, partial [Gammaproteobacteria bacterium]|nr:hypothetical protein [Gammaproteobacteria bacterium]
NDPVSVEEIHMADNQADEHVSEPGLLTTSEDFAAYCEAEFERRLNAGQEFDERAYRRAMELVIERLIRL